MELLLGVRDTFDGGTVEQEDNEEAGFQPNQQQWRNQSASTAAVSPPSSRVAPLRVTGGPSPLAVLAKTLKTY